MVDLHIDGAIPMKICVNKAMREIVTITKMNPPIPVRFKWAAGNLSAVPCVPYIAAMFILEIENISDSPNQLTSFSVVVEQLTQRSLAWNF